MVQTFFGPQEYLQKKTQQDATAFRVYLATHKKLTTATLHSGQICRVKCQKMDFNSLSLRNGNACALLISAEKIAFAKFLEKVPSGGGIKLIFLDTLWV